MATARLSRRELGWLLAQEARGAASALRKDVTLLTQPPPPDASAELTHEVHLESTLNALDDAIGMLSQLEAGPPTSRVRRGRIDVASLLCEVAPRARIAIEPGAGTEVFGEEAELRRLLHVLVSQATAASGSSATAEEVRIRGQDDWIRISVDLGPDVAASGDLERRWLSRMAIRLGGKLELDSGTQSVLLPADASADRSEVADLKKELAQAQQLGETYARELVAVLGANPDVTASETDESDDVALRRAQMLVSLSATLAKELRLAFRGLSDDAKAASDRLGEEAPLTVSLGNRATLGLNLVQDLTSLHEVDLDAPPTVFDLNKVAKQIIDQLAGRAARDGIEVSLEAATPLKCRTRRSPLETLLRALLVHAIEATPKGGRVAVRFAADKDDWVITVEDGGPTPPPATHADLVEHKLDPLSLGRPTGISLLAASALTARLGGHLSILEAGTSGTAVRITVPAS